MIISVSYTHLDVYKRQTMDNGKSRIIVTELPYMVNKAKLVEKIASLVKEKKVDGITDLRDESDQDLSLIHI